MKRSTSGRILLARISGPWLAACLAVAGYFALVHWAEAGVCGSDTECMERHGGDGSPDSADDSGT